MSNTKHTEGKIRVSSNGCSIETDDSAALGICAMYATEATQANAERICTAWNGYDKLKSDNEKLNLILKNITEGYFNGSTIQEVERNMRAAKNILKKANPKIEFKSPPQSLIDRYMEKWDLPQ